MTKEDLSSNLVKRAELVTEREEWEEFLDSIAHEFGHEEIQFFSEEGEEAASEGGASARVPELGLRKKGDSESGAVTRRGCPDGRGIEEYAEFCKRRYLASVCKDLKGLIEKERDLEESMLTENDLREQDAVCCEIEDLLVSIRSEHRLKSFEEVCVQLASVSQRLQHPIRV